MKIIHVASSLEDLASGTATVVPEFAKASCGADNSIELFSIGPRGTEVRDGFTQRKFEVDWPQVPVLNKLQSSTLMQVTVMATTCDVIHAHGLWGMTGIYAARAKVAHQSKLVVSPHGMLATDALRYSSLRKKLFAKILQNRALVAADLFHATSAAEVEDIRRAGWTQPVALIAPGIDVAEGSVTSPQKLRTILYVGRIHPIKRLGDVLDAWRELSILHPLWRIRIVGPDDTAEAVHLKQRIASEKLERISIEPALFGLDKALAYAEADVFVLPTQSENFAMVVAEALAHGVPVICSKGAPWAGLETERCGWWTDIGPEPLRVALNTALQLPRPILRQMGARGRNWMARDFSWGAVAQKLNHTYRWMIEGGERPDFVKETVR